jgi:hypothetical protein
MPEMRRFPRHGRLIVLLASLLYVCLSTHLPVSVFASTRHDDAWYYEHAAALVAGQWLGQFSQMTLMKGPGYSFFLALNFLLGLPVILSQALLYILACTLFAQAIFRLSHAANLSLATFLLMLWHPAIFPVRLIRDDIYAAQTLIFLACVIHVLLLPLTSRFQHWWAIAGGLSLAWLWLTREEGVWILPAIAILCAVRLWQERSRLPALLLFAGSAGVAAAIVASGNFIAYRTLAIVDFKGSAYSNAVSALQSVRVGEPVAYVPVPGKVRDQIYAASPSFAALKPYFEDVGKGYMQTGCKVYPSTCGDYAGGWFIWAFRDAVAWAGHYRTPQDAAQFYDQLTAEVRSACRSGELQCTSGLVAYMPPVTEPQWQQVPAKLGQLVSLLLSQSLAPAAPQSSGSAAQLKAMWAFEGFPRRTRAPSDPTGFSGSFYAKSDLWLQLRCSGGTENWAVPIRHLASPDIATHFNDATATGRRFSVELPIDATCGLQLAGAGPNDISLSHEQLLAGYGGVIAPDTQLHIDSFDDAPPNVAERYARWVVEKLSTFFGFCMPALAAAAGLSYVAHLILLKRGALRADNYWLLTHMLWLLVLSRVTILLLVDLSSFPAFNNKYLSASFPLLCSALLLTLYLPFRKNAKAESYAASTG